MRDQLSTPQGMLLGAQLLFLAFTIGGFLLGLLVLGGLLFGGALV